MTLPTAQQRLGYYLGSILGPEDGSFNLDDGGYEPHHLQTVGDLGPSHPGEPTYARGYLRDIYDAPLNKLIERAGFRDRRFLYAGNDRVAPDYGPVLAKNRRGSTEPVLLRCLNIGRHWRATEARDTPFDSKLDKVFWRGGSTGWNYRPSSRMKLVRSWSGKRGDIDVAFSHLCQEYALPGVREPWEAFVRGRVPRSTFLKHRYLVSAEGNDKDSGLNWKLRANSVVLMPNPVAESWLMEPFLQPFVHYVPLEDDFSDLAERLAWCRDNDRRCRIIMETAHAFMRQFDDLAVEEELERAVIRAYFARMRGNRLYSNISPTSTAQCPSAPISGASIPTSHAPTRRARPYMRMHVGFPAT